MANKEKGVRLKRMKPEFRERSRLLGEIDLEYDI